MTCVDCIRELKMAITGDLRPGYTLDGRCHMKKHLGKTWKEVIEQDPGYINWLYQTFSWFQLDEAAHNYLVETEEKQM